MSEMAGYATKVCGRAQRELPRYNGSRRRDYPRINNPQRLWRFARL